MSVPHPVPRRERLHVAPPLRPDDVAFLAGFGRHAVSDHEGERVVDRDRVARIWPGQPSSPCPWVPCAAGCCLHLVGVPGAAAAAQWLRFLLARFLEGAHHLSGTVQLPGRGRTRAVLIVDRVGVFEGEMDGRFDGGQEGLGERGEEPWSG